MSSRLIINYRYLVRGLFTALGLALLIGTNFAQTGTPAPTIANLSGTIGSMTTTGLVLTLATGSGKSITVPATATIIERVKATVADIKPGEALAVTADRQKDGSLKASLINIFAPETYERVRKGQFPMDSGSIMTNAVVDQSITKVDSHLLKFKLETGVTDIVVPDSVSVSRLVLHKPGALRNGMHVTIRATTQSDGSLVAANISIEP